jgi:alginate O-acetyltransferase complex protein AlgI
VNLMLTMLLGGLWHGAAWTFVVWGGLHGLYLVVERYLRRWFGHLDVWGRWPARIARGLLTYALVNVTWVFFRAQSFPAAKRVISAMLGLATGGAPVLSSYRVISAVAAVGGILLVHAYMRERELHAVVQRLPLAAAGALWGGMAFLTAITQGGSDAFIYFQF